MKVIRALILSVLRKKFTDRVELSRFQQRKIKSFERNVLSRSDYYRKYFVNGSVDWERIPVITKREFMEHFDEINTVGINLDHAMETAVKAEKDRSFVSEINGITIGLSTGTSGQRGLFLVSESERAQWAAVVLSRVVKLNLLKRKKVAFFLRANSNLYSSVESSLLEFRYFDIFRPVNELLSELDEFKPDVVAAQPSVLADIAAAQKNGIINISPGQIISFAEVLHDDIRQYVELQFKLKLTEVYQCTEGFLGVSCAHGNIHLNEDFIRIEKQYVAPGMFYPIITDFSRSSQPVVKYRLNDILVELSESCKCGSVFTALSRIEGRDDDVLEFVTTNGTVRLYPDLICRKLALHISSEVKFRIIQNSHSDLDIHIDADGEKFAEYERVFTRIINELLTAKEVCGVQLRYIRGFTIAAGEKQRRISNNIK